MADQPYTFALAWHPHAFGGLHNQDGGELVTMTLAGGTASGMADPRVKAWLSLRTTGCLSMGARATAAAGHATIGS